MPGVGWCDWWCGVTARERAMCAHPAGKGIPESAEVAQARMDDEAVDLANRYSRLDEWHHDWSQRNRWTDWIVPAGMVLALYVLVMLAAVAGEYAGGWAA